MIKLNVPYRSQWADDAKDHRADCGPTCVAMILNYWGITMTPDGVYAHIEAAKGPDDYTNFTELILATRANGTKLNYRRYENREEAFRNLRANLDAGNAAIALVKYLPWKPVLGNDFEGGHFVVVTGYDEDHVFIHDPLFGVWVKPAEKGAHYAMSNDLFAAGWESAAADSNFSWSLAYNGDVVLAASGPAVTPEPIPVVDPPPTPIPPTPVEPAQKMDDVNRRIRALAAYRWAEPPEFDDLNSVQIWLAHLGDFGLTYETYVVQAGDSLSMLAARHYGEQNRWPVIKAYNDLKRDGLFLNEIILIPQLGQSGAHLNPALPHDTAVLSKDLDSFIDPDQLPQDYDALVGESSKGIGFVDLLDE